jgi:hypothetical protein
MTVTTARFEVHPTKRAVADEKVASLYKQAAKVGAAVTVTAVDEDRVADGGAIAVWSILTVTHEDIALPGGWRAVAAWDISEAGIAVSALPGADSGIIARHHDRAKGGACDHCSQTRQRRFVFAIASSDGSAERVVGSSCVADFLGVKPGWLLRSLQWAEDFAGLDEPSDALGGGNVITSVRPTDFVAATRAVVRRFGYLSKTKAYEGAGSGIPTSQEVTDYLYGSGESASALRTEVGPITDEDYEVAANVVAHFSEDQPTDNDYLVSLHILCSQDRVPVSRAAGYLASALSAFQRDEQKRIQKAEAAPIPVNGERIIVTGDLLTLKEVESQYGITLKGLVLADDGWKVWGTIPAAIRGEVNVGDRVRFTARVEPSSDDATFGFFNRPTKAAVLSAV